MTSSRMTFLIFTALLLVVPFRAISPPEQLPSEEIEQICCALVTFHLSDFVQSTFDSRIIDETTFRTVFTRVLAENRMGVSSSPASQSTLTTKTKQIDFLIEFTINRTTEEALVRTEASQSTFFYHGRNVLCMGLNYRPARDHLTCDWIINLYHPNGTLRTAFPRRELVYWNPKHIRQELASTYYEMLDTLGVGVSSRVVRCRKKETGDIFAAKMIRKPKRHPVLEKRIRREIHILNQLYHPNLLRLYDTYEDDENFVLIVEHLSGGPLYKRGQVSESESVNYVRQICKAVKYLHERNIFHCDLTRYNIVCRTERCNEIVVVDFGEAVEHSLALMNVCISLIGENREGAGNFSEPKTTRYDHVVRHDDMLSVGVIAGFLLTGEYPPNESNNLDRALREQNISANGRDFVKRLLNWDEDEYRPPMNVYDSLNHPWLSKS